MSQFIQTNKYKTIGDDNIYYDVVEFAELGRPRQGDPFGIRQYELDDGSVVNRISPNEFLVLLTDVKLKII
jgi:hypothetical protein